MNKKPSHLWLGVLRANHLTGGAVINKGDFIRVEYTGYDDEGNVFDSTTGEIAKKLHGKEGPLLLTYGYDILVPGLQKALGSMKIGEENEISLSHHAAFGERRKEYLKVMPESEFRKQDVTPYPGLTFQINSDQGGPVGIVKSVTSGRIMVDFNHPLAGKNVKYKVKLIAVINDAKSKTSELLKEFELDGTVELAGSQLTINLKRNMDDKDFEGKKTQLKLLLKGLLTDIVEIIVKES